MANKLNENLTNRVVIIDAEHLRANLDRPELRTFHVEGGFGALPFTNGSALIGAFLYDGLEGRLEGWMVERFATEEEIAAAEAIREGGQS